MNDIKTQISQLLDNKAISERIDIINELREFIHEQSPFKNEPVDFVRWIRQENVVANDYNPNKVAPPEMELLEISIMNDGYTQPIVTWDNKEKGKKEVIDGFHRNRVGKESKIVANRIMGYLPIVNIRTEQSGKNDRIASTIRHNRARGKHQIDAMSEIVIELKNRNWTNERISKQLGMDEEEILRLCQISGLENLFTDSDFSKAWESSDSIVEEFEPISDDVSNDEMGLYKIPNESDTERIFHTYDKWECYKYGFYDSKKEGLTDEQCENKYIEVLSNSSLFESILEKVITEWKHSCEHYLTNKSMNRIAWLGQAAVCYYCGVPAVYSSGWNKLTDKEKNEANKIALIYLNKWLSINNLGETEEKEALCIGRQIELY